MPPHDTPAYQPFLKDTTSQALSQKLRQEGMKNESPLKDGKEEISFVTQASHQSMAEKIFLTVFLFWSYSIMVSGDNLECNFSSIFLRRKDTYYMPFLVSLSNARKHLCIRSPISLLVMPQILHVSVEIVLAQSSLCISHGFKIIAVAHLSTYCCSS